MSPTLALISFLLLLWLVLPLPLAVLLGRCIRAGEVGDAARRRARQELDDAADRFADVA